MNFTDITADNLQEHLRLLLAWRNDEQTRRASRRTELFTEGDYYQFLLDLLCEGSVIRIAFSDSPDSEAVGVVVAEPAGSDSFELSWTVNPACRGRGIGKTMVKEFASDPLFQNKLLKAVVKKENRASIRIVESLDFRKVEEDSSFSYWERIS